MWRAVWRAVLCSAWIQEPCIRSAATRASRTGRGAGAGIAVADCYWRLLSPGHHAWPACMMRCQWDACEWWCTLRCRMCNTTSVQHHSTGVAVVGRGFEEFLTTSTGHRERVAVHAWTEFLAVRWERVARLRALVRVRRPCVGSERASLKRSRVSTACTLCCRHM